MAATVVGEDVPQHYENITQPHVASFDYFLGEGMHQVVDLLPLIEVRTAGQLAS